MLYTELPYTRHVYKYRTLVCHRCRRPHSAARFADVVIAIYMYAYVHVCGVYVVYIPFCDMVWFIGMRENMTEV